MAAVKPFEALRYTNNAGDLNTLVCPPYDIISDTERAELINKNPRNIVRLEKPVPEPGIADPYEFAGDFLQSWLADETLMRDDTPALYAYQFAWDDKTLDGVVARVRLEEFSKGIILPHEETLSKAKEDRYNLMLATRCNFSSIYSLFNAPENFSPLVPAGEPISAVTDSDGVIHRLWRVTDPAQISSYCDSLRDTRLYIADGHHRYETALKYRDAQPGSDYIMMLLVEMSHPGLVVLPTHRIVHSLPDFDAEAFLRQCEEYFTVETSSGYEEALKNAFDSGKKAFGFYAKNKHGEKISAVLISKNVFVSEKILPEVSLASRSLDVQLLHALALERVLGIDRENMSNQKNLRYTRDWDEAVLAVDDGGANAAFMLNPTRVSEIRDVALAGDKMPQKSTYFYPKIITGLTINQL